MEIPLKSKPKVSMVGLLDDTKFGNSNTHDHSIRKGTIERLKKEHSNSPHSSNYKLTRTYSETETNNFDVDTGHRLFDDGKIRPTMSRTSSPVRKDTMGPNQMPDATNTNDNITPRIYSRSHDESMADDPKTNYQGIVGMEDEYIPGLDFGDMIYRWNRTSEDLSRKTSRTTMSPLGTPHSREASYLDLNSLHSKVAPQPIMGRKSGNMSFSKLSDLVRLRTPQGNRSDTDNSMAQCSKSVKDESNGSPSSLVAEDPLAPPKSKRQKSTTDVINPETGEINYELILNSLPTNFNDLPYSQRKKLIKSYSESIDYSQFSLVAKQYFSDKFNSPASVGGRLTHSGSFVRRSRRNSANTVAGRLLALSSSTDLKKLSEELKPKENVDEKGAIVLGHELGKVIGFGAWGTIRECKNIEDGGIKACKIVKSCRFESNSPSSKQHNPRVLERFRKEIEIWSKLQHPNILPLLKHFETETSIFCITDRIYGGTLFEVVSNWGVFNTGIHNSSGPIGFSIQSQKERINKIQHMAVQLVDALVYMHEVKGIVHGDIKLENVLVDNTNTSFPKAILCDFGMSRVYSARVSRRNSVNRTLTSEEMARSKSSMTTIRKPLPSNFDTKFLFQDDSKIGISNFARSHGPSLQSIDLTPTQSNDNLTSLTKFSLPNTTTPKQSEIESNLPHSHIGSLPYASPELILPSPPPLGPSADIWALGVLLYTMIVGKLPFQHQYEPRLRAMISAGKCDTDELKRACLVEFIFDDKDRNNSIQSSFMDLKREEDIDNLTTEWKNYDSTEFQWMYELISGCLTSDITKRFDILAISNILKNN